MTAKKSAKKTSPAKPSKTSKTTGTKSAVPAWDKLKHARGSAKLVPAVIAALADGGRKGNEAMAALTEAFVAKGDAYSASAPAFVALAEALSRLGDERRAQVLELLIAMLALGDVSSVEGQGLDLTDAKVRKRYASGDAAALMEAAVVATPSLLQQLEASSAAVRRDAALLCGYLPGPGLDVTNALVARLAREDDGEAADRIVFALAYRAATRPDEKDAARSSLERLRADADRPPALRAAAAVGLAFVDRSLAAAPKPAELVSFFAASAANAWSSLASVGDNALLFLGGGRLGDAGRELATRAALEGLVAAKPAPGASSRITWPKRALDWYFPERKGGENAFIKDPLDVESLTKPQRAILELLASVPNEGVGYAHAGLPESLRARRRMLGLDPAGPLEERVKVGKGSSPRWALLLPALDKYGSLAPAKRPPLKDYLEKDAFSLTTAQWLELWAEVKADSYRLSTTYADAALQSALETAPGDVVTAWVKRYVEEMRRGDDPDLVDRISASVLAPLVRASGAKPTLPTEYDGLVRLTGPVQNVRQVLQAVPADRRERIVEALIAARRDSAPMERLNFLERIAVNFLDLVPEATAAILQELDRPENSRIQGISSGVDNAFDELRKKVPRVDAILRAYETKKR